VNYLIIKATIIYGLVLLVTGCQSVDVIHLAGLDTNNKQDFVLNTETTFRPFDEIRTLTSAYLYTDEIRDSYYDGFPYWPNLKGAGGGDSLSRNHFTFTSAWKTIISDALRAYVTTNSRLAEKVIETLSQAASHDALLGTISARSAHRQPCWKGGGSSSCPFHHAQTAAEFFIHSIHAANLIRP